MTAQTKSNQVYFDMFRDFFVYEVGQYLAHEREHIRNDVDVILWLFPRVTPDFPSVIYEKYESKTIGTNRNSNSDNI